ncbi:Gluconolactonase [Rhodovastum atsumiense]|uniref:SMP-30/gluconolactonase/LRE family protein n=1 Tax=Rhodovastum atsumiense TaxID=504468 RepID=A0A5M6IQL6_9PROT|nr:SMP-30/gluconolactonase/LRE family protein [Rhodovastum atsumiense]KAA5610573.1 SMP-30/gluconolactonase/LRE family protein [Rhodovastum atsumiense]CAH2600683.1 Gluconolactonase [Rhodovastum atsumiense]
MQHAALRRVDPTRRGIIRGATALAGAAVLGPAALAQPAATPGTPPSVVTNPPRQWGRASPPTIYPDPDIIVLDPSFAQYMLGITAMHRLATGFKWTEGPAWSSQGQYLVFSDVQANTQYRYLWDDGRVTAFRRPSYNSNGNAFDFQGRQLSTQDFFRRVVRWEHDGTLTVIADRFEGKPLNSPNDLVAHPDGSIWFTDPAYGATLSEGHPDVAGGPTNPQGLLNPRIGAENAEAIGGQRRALPTNVYRWDPGGRLDVVITEDQIPDPNGLCFSPDHRTLYVCSTGKGPGDTGPGGRNSIFAFDVQGQKLGGMRLFTDMVVDGVHCGPDGVRTDVTGAVWCSANAPLGYAGVLVFNPAGRLIGRLRLPEVAANLTFGGPKRNHLLICASQSLYVLQVQTQGAAPG